MLSLSLLLSLLPLCLSLPSQPVRRANSPAGTVISSLLASDTSDALIELTSSEESSLNLPTAAVFASAAYCPAVRDGTWSCVACGDVSDAELLWESGDGTDTPYVYIAYSPSLQFLVVAHQGTNTSSLDSWIDDGEFAQTNLDSSLNDGTVSSSTVQVHEGFQDTFLSTSSAVLSEVKSALAGAASEASLILVTGHSLGAALSVFEALHLRINLASSYEIQQVGFGQPRVGNQAFAEYYEAVMGDNQMRVTNQNDIVPHLPPEDDGYYQPTDEIWQESSSVIYLCPGNENDNCANSYGDFDYSTSPHDGPYFTVTMGTAGCS